MTYTLELHVLGEKKYTPPIPFKDVGFVFANTRTSPTEYFYLIKLLGSALEFGGESEVREYRQKLEEIFLDTPATYEILTIYSDQISFWKTGAYGDKRSLGVFEYHPQ